MKMLHMAEYALYEIHPNGGINLTAELKMLNDVKDEMLNVYFCFVFPKQRRGV
jgi:hypothetical protein